LAAGRTTARWRPIGPRSVDKWARGHATAQGASAGAVAVQAPAKPGPAITLVRAHGDLPLRYARLRRSIQATFGTQIRMTPLPGVLTDALRLVDELAR
jgi:hypothetical protein